MKTQLGTHVDFHGDFEETGWFVNSNNMPAFQTYVSTRQNSWWPSKPLDPITYKFRELTEKSTGVAHGPFVFNILTDPAGYRYANNQWKGILKHMDLMDRLGIKYFVLHPGSAKGAPNDKAMSFAVAYLRNVFDQYEGDATLCLENHANPSTGPAASFRMLSEIVDIVDDPRLGMCLDTTHAFASGIDLRIKHILDTVLDYDKYFKVIHFNNPEPSVTCGSKRDRHSSLLDEGPLSLDVMKSIWNKFSDRPMILEGTPDYEHDRAIVQSWEDETSGV